MRCAWELPKETVTFRRISGDCIALVSKWIACGHVEGAFQQINNTKGSILAYQKQMRKLNDVYECFIIRINNKAVGYFDLTVCGRSGEILGLYITPKTRRKGIGELALRYAIARMRKCGCTQIAVEIYENNTASIKMCEKVGFKQVSQHECVISMLNEVNEWPTMVVVDRAYAALRGENWYDYHVAIADAICDRIRRHKGVEAILGLGSLFRGFGDRWSDLDLAVLARGDVVDELWKGERWIAGVSVDLFVVDLDAMPINKWDKTRRQAFEESVVLYCKSKNFLRSFRKAISLRHNEQRFEIAKLLLQLGWLGFAPKTWFNKKKYGYTWSLSNSTWIDRGCLASAHITIDRATDTLLQMLFLLNNRLPPDQKWRRFLAPDLQKLPHGFLIHLNKIEQAPRTLNAYAARSESLVKLVGRTCKLIEHMLADNMYQQFIQKSDDYNPRR